MPHRAYWEHAALEQIYLEDSYVFGIEECAGELVFEMEFVLRGEHPLYEPPKPSDQYCFRKGRLVFHDVKEVKWLERRDVGSWDATGQRDFGNIDALHQDDHGWFQLEGDWGKVDVRAEGVEVRF